MGFIENGFFITNETNTLRANAANKTLKFIRGIRAKSKPSASRVRIRAIRD
jgi:hypothetical protein